MEKGVDHLKPLAGRMGSMGELVEIRNLAKQNNLDFSSDGTTFVNAVLVLHPVSNPILWDKVF